MQHGQMVKQSGLPRAEEAREDGHGHALLPDVILLRLLRRFDNSRCHVFLHEQHVDKGGVGQT